MVPQPPPVAPKSAAAKITLQTWQQAQNVDLIGEEITSSSYGNHVRCGSVDSVDSNSSSSVSSSGSSGGHCRQISHDGEFIPTRTVVKTQKQHNPLQFVKVNTPFNKKQAEYQPVKEVKVPKNTLKESEEEWQSNLDNWKSRRRKVSEKVIQRAEEMRQIEAEEQLRQQKEKEQQRKIKTFSEIIEKRTAKRSYNLDLYIGQGDDSGVGETPEPDEHEAELDGPHLSMRSDTSEGMTSETDSLDSDLHGSEKVLKEPPKVPKKPHSWLSRQESNEIMSHRTSSPKLLQSSLSGKDPPSDSVSSAEPSDVEGPIDIETMSSEDDTGFCRHTRQMDSGLESLCDSHRPNDTTDSASDLSQDSCSGMDKISSEPEVPKRRKKPVLQKSVTLHGDDEFLDNGDVPIDENTIRIKIMARPNFDGFGFVLKGGKDHGQDAFIDFVTPGSPAYMAGLKAGDVILSINGEPTSGYSHASLVFSIKQALYSKELDMTVCRNNKDMPSAKEQKQPGKKGNSFAEKLAMFSGDTSAPKSDKPQNGDINDSKVKSLILRRRTAFEKSPAEVEEAKNRRASCVSPENTKIVEEERRHSMEVGNLVDQIYNSKKPPPPVPVKPARMKSKPLPPVPSEVPEQIYHSPQTENSSLEPSSNEPELENLIPISEKEFENGGASNYEEFPIPENQYEEPVEDTFDNDRFVEMYVRHVDQSSPQDFAELSHDDVSPDEDMNSFPMEQDVDPPETVDSNVNNVEEIVDKVQQVSLGNESPPPYEDSITACEQYETQEDTVIYKSVLYLDNSMSRHEQNLSPDLNDSQEQPQIVNFQNGSELEDNDGTEVATEEFVYDEVPDEQDIIDSDISTIDREHFIQINMHPMALPLEKIDEDDGISASTTSSSETPDTETIIDNLPTNISPLPTDDTPEVVCSNGAAVEQTEQEAIAIEAAIIAKTEPELVVEAVSEDVPEDGQHALENLMQYSERLDTAVVDEELQEELYELEEGADQLSPLDVIDQIEMKLMQQLEREAMDDFVDTSNGQLEEEVTRQLMYLSEDTDLLDDLDAPRNVVPPSEPPPPPPPEPEYLENKANSFQRINSTKRIKKELWRRRSDFLGLDSPEAISVEDLPPPPPGLEELLKSEVELEREQRLFLEKQLSLVESEYSSLNELEAGVEEEEEEYDPSEEYTRNYVMSALDAASYDEVDPDLQNEEWKTENECQIPDSEMVLQEQSLESLEKERQSASPQNKVKTHIQSLGAAPRAKIMDSSKWITQTEHVPVLRQKSLEPVFQGGSYNQNFWIAQEASMRSSMEPAHVPVDRRYSMPPACSGNRQPNVTVRTWGDREAEYPPIQSRPKSAVWQGGPPPIAQTCPTQAYGYADGYQGHRSSWNDNARRCVQEEPQTYEVNHQCSCCGTALTEGSAMGIEALQLYFHIECFRCCVCRLQLGNGSCGTDVQVKNSQLFCPKCFLID